MKTLNPFDHDVFAAGVPGANGIHEEVLAALATTAEELTLVGESPYHVHTYGRTTLLLAPRAGYGKSHLLSRLSEELENQVFVVPLNFEPELPSDWRRLSQDLASLLRVKPIPNDPYLTHLDEVARFYFGQLVILGIQSGLVEADNRTASMSYIYENYTKLFDQKGELESRAIWFQEAYEPLMESLAPELAKMFAITEPAAVFWGRVFYEFTFPKTDTNAAKGKALKWAMEIAYEHGETDDSERGSKDRFCDLAQIASAVRPLVFVVDHLDGFHGDERSGIKIAHLLAEVARNVPRSLLVLSTNLDIWNSMFAKSIPSALEDRLSWDKRQLEPLTIGEAEKLVMHRIADCGYEDHQVTAFVDALNLQEMAARSQEQAFTPRTLIRYARRVWENFSPAKVAKPESPESKTVPFPIVKTKTPGAEPEAQPKPAALKGRDRLHAVAQAIRQHGVRKVRTEASFQEGNPVSVPLPELYQRHRLEHVEQQALEFGPERLFELISAVGDHFPTITQTELDLPPGVNGSAMTWTTQDREIYIGFAPQSSYRFWQVLIKMVQDRVAESGSDHSIKLVVPSSSAEPFPVNRLYVSSEQAEKVSPILDALEIDHELLASLYAAEDILESQTDESNPSQLFGFIATELDYFWRRLTRMTMNKSNSSQEAVG